MSQQKLTIKMKGEDYHRNKTKFKEFLKAEGFIWTGDWQNSKFTWIKGRQVSEETCTNTANPEVCVDEKVTGIFKRDYQNDKTEEAELFLEMSFETYCMFFDFWFAANNKRIEVFVREPKTIEKEEEIPFILKNWISMNIAPFIRARLKAPKPFTDLMLKDFKDNLLKELSDRRYTVKCETLEKYFKSEYNTDFHIDLKRGDKL